MWVEGLLACADLYDGFVITAQLSGASLADGILQTDDDTVLIRCHHTTHIHIRLDVDDEGLVLLFLGHHSDGDHFSLRYD